MALVSRHRRVRRLPEHDVSAVLARSIRPFSWAWDELARRKGVSSAEDMLAPYVSRCPDMLKNAALVEGGSGCLAPLAQGRVIYNGLAPSAICGCVCAEVLGSSQAADEHLHLGAKVFFDHLDKVTARKKVWTYVERPSAEPRYRLKKLHSDVGRKTSKSTQTGVQVPQAPQPTRLIMSRYRFQPLKGSSDGVPPMNLPSAAGLTAVTNASSMYERLHHPLHGRDGRDLLPSP